MVCIVFVNMSRNVKRLRVQSLEEKIAYLDRSHIYKVTDLFKSQELSKETEFCEYVND